MKQSVSVFLYNHCEELDLNIYIGENKEIVEITQLCIREILGKRSKEDIRNRIKDILLS